MFFISRSCGRRNSLHEEVERECLGLHCVFLVFPFKRLLPRALNEDKFWWLAGCLVPQHFAIAEAASWSEFVKVGWTLAERVKNGRLLGANTPCRGCSITIVGDVAWRRVTQLGIYGQLLTA